MNRFSTYWLSLYSNFPATLVAKTR